MQPDNPITAIERDVLVKLETGKYLLKFGQLYRIEQATLFPTGPQLGNSTVDRMLNNGFIKLVMLTINGVGMKAHTITDYGRERLLRS